MHKLHALCPNDSANTHVEHVLWPNGGDNTHTVHALMVYLTDPTKVWPVGSCLDQKQYSTLSYWSTYSCQPFYIFPRG